MNDRSDFGTGLRAHLRLDGSADGIAVVEAPPIPAPEEPLEPEASRDDVSAELAARSRELEERGRALDARAQALAEEWSRLEALRAELRTSWKPGEDVRAYLRERAERCADLLWTVLEEALAARTADGRADHASRVAAVRTLLHEAYGGEERPWELLPPGGGEA